MGCRGGAAEHLEETFRSHIVSIHCVANKLELGVMDAVKKDSYLTKFEETSKGVYRFYHRANSRRRILKDLAAVVEADLLR